jgi:succinyl-diaminopimelate desuccinylase
MHLKVKIQGKRAHGAYPWRGVNAIDIAINILKEIKAFKFIYKKNKYLRPPTVNIGTIKGGDKVNVVADYCEFELDFRFLPGMAASDLLRGLKNIINKHTKKFSRQAIQGTGRIPLKAGAIEIEGIQETYRIDETHSLVTGLAKAMKQFKVRPLIRGSEGATVITFFQHKNIPAVATGFGCDGCAHISDEYVKIDNLYKGAFVLEEFLKNYKFS